MVPEPKNIRIIATIALVKFPSSTEEKALLYPRLTASVSETPFPSSSPIRSLMIMLASTAIPMVSMIPAIPGSVSVYCGIEIASSCMEV